MVNSRELAAPIAALIAVSLAGACRKEASGGKSDESPAGPAQPVASAASAEPVRPADAAPPPVAAVAELPIAIEVDRLGFVSSAPSVTRALLEQKLPGLTITTETESGGEDEEYTLHAVKRGEQELFRIRTSTAGELIAFITESPEVENRAGVRVGEPFEALRRAVGELDCWHEVEWDEYVLCKGEDRATNITYGFHPVDGTGPLGGGDDEDEPDFTPERQAALLAGQKAGVIVWTKPGP